MSDFKKSRKWYRKETENEVTYSPIRVNKTEYFADPEERAEYAQDYVTGTTKALKPVPLSGNRIVEITNQNKKCIYLGDNFFEREVEESVNEEVDMPPPGIYRYRHEGAEVLLPFEPRELEEYIPLGSWFEEVDQDIKAFLDNPEYFAKKKFLYKFGALMWGPPNNGKSTLLGRIVKESLPKDALVIYMDGDLFTTEFMEAMKYSLKDVLKVFVFEEFATNMDSGGYVRRLLTFMDGEHSMGNTIILATTNHPELIPGNLVDREQRIDRLYEFDNPGADDRRKLLEKYLGEEPTESMVKKTEGYSVGAIKDVVIRMGLTQSSFEDTIKKINERKKIVKKGFAKSKDVGFGRDYDY